MAVSLQERLNLVLGTGDRAFSANPANPPRGCVVFIIHNANSDFITGVDYGGVSLTEVTGSPLGKGGGEPGIVHCFFAGSGLPSGAQSVTIDTSSGSTYCAICYVLDGSTDLELVDIETLSSNSLANPSATLSLNGRECFAAVGGFSGQDTFGGVTPLSGWNNSMEQDFGTQMGVSYDYLTIGSADVSAGWTQTAEDVVAIAVAIGELAGVTGSGGVTVPATLDGTGTVAGGSGITGTGDASALPALAGAGTVSVLGSGTASLTPALAGTGTITASGTGAVSVTPGLAGAGALAGAGVTGSGGVSTAPALAGSGTITITGSGGVTVTPAVAGTGPGAGTTGVGAITVAAPTLAGSGTLTVTGTGDVRMAPVLAGSGQVRVQGSGDARVTPVLGGDGLVVQPVTGSGGVVVAFAVAGTGSVPVTSVASGGKYRAEWSGAKTDLAGATGFASEWAGARGDLSDAGA